MKYRSDIDGLRTMAIMPVIFYHASIALFPGGYVGVDIFFVISGYLITSIIVKELNEGRFTIANFYVRRVKRIFPALFFLISFAFVLSFFSLMPAHFQAFGKSVISTVLFSSNILFYSESGYFDTAAETKPLLHTWSLGVEEQFYIFFPVMLMLIARYGGKHYRRWAIGIFMVSLGLSVYAIGRHPDAAFYLIPFRAWELMLGALISLNFFPKTDKPAYLHLMSVTGFVMLLISIFCYTKDTEFPGYAALLPCLGTALIIMSEGGIANRILSFKPVVWVGLLSYSLYLWHWVLFALRNYWANIGIPDVYKSDWFLILLTFAFASFSYYVVERPLRLAKIKRKKLFLSTAVSVMALFTALGYYVVRENGLPQRIPAEASGYAKIAKSTYEIPACYGYSYEKITYAGLCRLGDPDKVPSFILWGDSHGLVMSDGIDKFAKERHIAGVLAVKAACAPMLGVTRPAKPKSFQCVEFNDKISELIKNNKNLRNVFLAGRWESGAEGDSSHFYLSDEETVKPSKEENLRVFERGLGRTFERMDELNRNTLFLMDNPEFAYDVPRALAVQAVLKHYLPKLAEGSEVFSPVSRYDERNAKVRGVLNRLSEKYRFKVVNMAEGLCVKGRCKGSAGSESLYMDDNHLSPYGAEYMLKMSGRLIDGAL